MKRCRLIYRSSAKESTLNQETLTEIARTGERNNKRDGIMGILVLSGDQFLQVLEGPINKVNQLYSKILLDDRHTNVELVLYEPINTPYFYDWHMRLIQLEKISAVEREKLLKKYPNQDGKLIVPDNLILLYSLLHDARELF